MIPDGSAKCLWDAQDAVQRVNRFIFERSFEDYLGDEMFRSAVERQLGIVGEALEALRRRGPDLAATIPHLPRIVAFRNILVHGYANVDDALVWGVVQRYLPELLATLERLLPRSETGRDRD